MHSKVHNHAPNFDFDRMSNALFAVQSLAQYQFLDGYVNLAKWDEPQQKRMEAALALPKDGVPSPQMTEDRALLMHEITHFLDATTTLWGQEFTWRKINAAKLIKNGEDEDKVHVAVEALMLNLSELAAHHALRKATEVETLRSDLVMVHQLVRDERHGLLISFHLMDSGRIIHTIPLSMRSILEANAYANENLLRISDARRNPDAKIAAVEQKLIENTLIKALANPELSEYTILIRLTRLHFPQLDLEQQLVLVAVLARFCLDVDSLSMSAISPHLDFQNAFLGEAIKMDLRRGASRAVLFIKTVFGIYSEIEEGVSSGLMDLLMNDPKRAIIQFWTERVGLQIDILADKEFMLEGMPSGSGLLDEQIFAKTSQHNRALLKNFPAGKIPFEEFFLIDSLLGDLTPVRPPNRVDIDVEAALDDNLAVLGRLQTLCADEKISKFHMGPIQAQLLLKNLR